MGQKAKPVAISLFSGAGGLDIGVEDAGFEVRCSVELNRFACETLRANKELGKHLAPENFAAWFRSRSGNDYPRWGDDQIKLVEQRVRAGVGAHTYLEHCEVLERDITTLRTSTVLEAARLKRGDLDLVFGGPPCQSFSRAGKRESVDDERGRLFLDFVRIVSEARPRWFLFENVKGLILTKTSVWSISCSCGIDEIPAFDPERTEPDASSHPPACRSCGSEKTRWRIDKDRRGGALDLIVSEFERIGYHCHPFVLDAADYGAPQHRERLFIVGSRDGEIPAIESGSLSGEGRARHRTLWDALFQSKNPYHDWPLDPETAVLWVKNVVRPHDEPVTWDLRRPSPTIGAHQGAKLAIAPRGVPLEQLARQQWHVLGRRQGDTKPVKVDHSYLSDEDLLTLQTFPRHWFVAGTRMERVFQIGNAVPPVLAKVVASALVDTKPTEHRQPSVSPLRLERGRRVAAQQGSLF